MKAILIVGLALAVVMVNAGRFDACKAQFEAIARNPIFTTQKPTDQFIKQNSDSLIKSYVALWREKCNNEIKILLNTNSASMVEIYYANDELDRNFGVMQGLFSWTKDTKEAYVFIYTNYVHRFRRAVVEAFKNSKNQKCKKQIEELAQINPSTRTVEQASQITSRLFDIFEFCESNKSALLVLSLIHI
eukprot:TRINITY_DN4169_c0_g1_i1.p1 TRINITY_DN4169_c0_g1~~TRINITY_DN4169_c0_g1_i1.p1  ORF type:complete len:189 (+),score=57.87 TRINITY_DN4169_c0_g1_i1:197-763(+)